MFLNHQSNTKNIFHKITVTSVYIIPNILYKLKRKIFTKIILIVKIKVIGDKNEERRT